jgi:hypothetical protein
MARTLLFEMIMSDRAAVVIAFAIVACGRNGIEVAPGADMSPTATLIDRYIADGADPTAFANLANALEIVRDARDREVAADAELRLLALAAPLVDEARMSPIDEQVDALALTVWPALLAAPLTGIADAATTPAAGESATAYLLRLCSDTLAAECGAAPAVGVRSLAVHRANLRMHQVIGGCLHCATDDEPGWRAAAYRWESLDRQMAIRQPDGILDSEPIPTANLRAARGFGLARELR